MPSLGLLAHEEPLHPDPNSNRSPEVPFKSMGSKVNIVLETWDHLKIWFS